MPEDAHSDGQDQPTPQGGSAGTPPIVASPEKPAQEVEALVMPALRAFEERAGSLISGIEGQSADVAQKCSDIEDGHKYVLRARETIAGFAAEAGAHAKSAGNSQAEARSQVDALVAMVDETAQAAERLAQMGATADKAKVDLQARLEDIGKVAARAEVLAQDLARDQATIAEKSAAIQGAWEHAGTKKAEIDGRVQAAAAQATEAEEHKKRSQSAAAQAAAALEATKTASELAKTEIGAIRAARDEALAGSDRIIAPGCHERGPRQRVPGAR